MARIMKKVMSTKKPATQMPRATKRGTPVPMPMKPRNATKRGTPVPMPKKSGNIATGSKKTARPVPTVKVTKKRVITPRMRLDVSKMTPAQKKAYYDQPGYDNY